MRLQVLTAVEIPEEFGSFQEAEGKIREGVVKAGEELMRELFSRYEAFICEKRKSFWKKDCRERVFDTLVGRIRMKRWRVHDVRQGKDRYPLDEWLRLKGSERATPGLTKAIVEACVQRPYRQATKEIERRTGVTRSRMTNWKLIQEVAREERVKEEPVPDWYLKPLPSLDPRMKEDPCPILAIDPDATYCHNREKTLPDHEVKMAVLYTAKEPEDGRKRRWRLQNKRVFFSRSSESVREFHNRVTQMAMSHYGAHLESRIVIHGDGDPWIKSLKVNYWDQAVIRLDPWHVLKKIRLATGLTQVPSEWRSLVYGHPDELIFKLQGFKLQKTAPHSDQHQKIEDLIAYLKNNREGLLPSGVPQEIKKKYPRMFIRGSGTIESNIGHHFNSRFKQPRMSWSSRGLDNLSYLRERDLNGETKPRYRVPKPLIRKVA